MGFWNLIIVLCFAILYLGIALVFLQLRRLRDELKIHYAMRQFPDPEEEERAAAPSPVVMAQLCGEVVRKELNEVVRKELIGMQDKLNMSVASMAVKLQPELEAIHRHLQPELEAIHRQLRYIERMIAVPAPLPPSRAEEPPPQEEGDAYQMARRLLASGLHEDQVIAKTGLTVEEVSLLKRLSQVTSGEVR